MTWRDLFAHQPDENEVCSFCKREFAQVRKLIEGAHELRICDGCVQDASELLEKPEAGVEYVACSFCRQSLALVHFERHGHRICDPCVGLCVEILVEADAARAEANLPVARVVKRDRPRS